MLPLVCKRWACILGRPSKAWEHTDIDMQALDNLIQHAHMPHRPFLDGRVIAAWWTR